ncbi:MAG: OstA-like protein, partial [Rhodothermales bacterium]
GADTTADSTADTTVDSTADTTESAAADTTADTTPDSAQTREVEVSANLLEGDVQNGERVRRLIGNVQLRQEETHLRAQRAIQFLERREILFTGDVLVVERGDSLRADTVLYNSRDKTGRADGSVHLSDGDVVVRAPSGLYFTREKRARFTAGVTLVDSTAKLSSRAGQYWSDEKRAEFYGDVVLLEERTYLEADSVTYLRETDISQARGNVFIERMGGEAETDSLTRTLLFGHRAYNEDSTEYSRIEGDPLLVRLRADSLGAESDTLLIRAGVLESMRIDSAGRSVQRLVAVDSVRIWQPDLASVADSVVYDRVEADGEGPVEFVYLFGGPVAWFQNNQVTGDTLRLRGRDGGVDSLFVDGSAFVARRDSALEKIHQLRGGRLAAAFERDSLRSLVIGPQAEAINFRSDEEGAGAGAVRMSADRIAFRFRGDDLRRIEAVRGTEGTYYSQELIPPDLALEGFTWIPGRRPSKSGLLRGTEIPRPVPGLTSNRYTEPERIERLQEVPPHRTD